MLDRANKIIRFLLELNYKSFFLSATILMTVTFLVAYFSPAKAVTIYIDNFKEATPELIYIVFAWFMIFTRYILIKNDKKKK